MIKHNLYRGIKIRNIAGILSLLLALTSIPARAEDPLLGTIKVIKCVGCEPGKVTLVIHDPIEVRDFEVTILDADYSKIITPLPGKKVFDRGDACFYWNEESKVAKPEPVKVVPKPPVKETSKKGKKGKGSKKDISPTKDSTVVASDVHSESAPAPAVTPSKCIPYVRTGPPPASLPD